jgi:hypothetical protein
MTFVPFWKRWFFVCGIAATRLSGRVTQGISPSGLTQRELFASAQRGNVSLSNLQVLNVILYVAEHGCKWRSLSKRFGKRGKMENRFPP